MKRQDKAKKAAALRYKKGEDHAPVLVAKGKGPVAEKIIQLAREMNIPLKEDPKVVELLSALELNREIPPELYKAVAEILAFIYRMSNKAAAPPPPIPPSPPTPL
ncbi:MAG: EscU/YscU/HrcU family type III secretion system export apparatus switch protein [Nitrospiraceae bacterium]|nr:EscU/YscU/HrcU family type III secretion system export apparatus switch protein [Nitrospiraceae bacterium]